MNIIKNMKRIYLASPYSHPSEKVMHDRFEEVAIATAYLMETEDAVVYSPIVHSHVVAKYLNNHKDHLFWLKQDRSHVATCDELCVYKMDGWKESFGVTWEMGLASGLGILVSYLSPKVVKSWYTKRVAEGERQWT